MAKAGQPTSPPSTYLVAINQPPAGLRPGRRLSEFRVPSPGRPDAGRATARDERIRDPDHTTPRRCHPAWIGGHQGALLQ